MRIIFLQTLTLLFFIQFADKLLSANFNNTTAPAVVVEQAFSAEKRPVRRYVGSVEAINNVQIVPRITGELRKINFTEGSSVKAGDILYEIEDTTYQAAVQILEAQLEAQKATLTFASTEYERRNKLFKSNTVSAASHEQALMEINIAKANIKRLEAQLADARNTLSYTRITAPVSGRISKSNVTAGNLLTPVTGTMADIQQLSPIYVKFSISEKVLRRNFGGVEKVPEIASVQVILADGTLLQETARITLVDNKVNRSSNTVTMWATFKNKNLELLPGSFVTVLLTAENSKAALPTVLPSALVMENEQCFVWVLDTQTNIPVRRKVKIGETTAGRIVIIEGIKNGETVIVDGTHKLRPDAPVTPVNIKNVFKSGR
ncbi:MAG: efflux RND transporter periplasmic adaptor subunit [Lentisphaeria bacterium]|nr:efflux RND transporter periplasmic adaptor subunit [Lentisphaeria bacterium]